LHADSQTVREIAYRRLADRAVAGDIKAFHFLLSLESERDSIAADGPHTLPSAEQDLEIIRAYLDRRLPEGSNKP
jgi:hypothetical protein